MANTPHFRSLAWLTSQLARASLQNGLPASRPVPVSLALHMVARDPYLRTAYTWAIKANAHFKSRSRKLLAGNGLGHATIGTTSHHLVVQYFDVFINTL